MGRSCWVVGMITIRENGKTVDASWFNTTALLLQKIMGALGLGITAPQEMELSNDDTEGQVKLTNLELDHELYKWAVVEVSYFRETSTDLRRGKLVLSLFYDSDSTEWEISSIKDERGGDDPPGLEITPSGNELFSEIIEELDGTDYEGTLTYRIKETL